MADKPPVIGVLDLQGGVQEHLDHFDRAGVAARRIKTPEDFVGLKGLVLPGGESTCLSRLMRLFTLDQALLDAHRQGVKLWGACAGAILLASEILGESPHFGLIDMTVRRNAFGSQLDSFHCTAEVPAVSPDPIDLTFIRAPQIIRVGAGVRVLLSLDSYVAAAENDSILVTVFHPELTPSLAFHRYFAEKCGVRSIAPVTDGEWDRASWMRFSRITSPARKP